MRRAKTGIEARRKPGRNRQRKLSNDGKEMDRHFQTGRDSEHIIKSYTRQKQEY